MRCKLCGMMTVADTTRRLAWLAVVATVIVAIGGSKVPACEAVSPYANPDAITGAYNVPPFPLHTKEYDVRSFGAVGDGRTNNTAAFAAAIHSAAQGGGGVVLVEAGRYLSGPIALASGVYLKVNDDATLLASPLEQAYPDPFTPSFVTCTGCDATGIVGGGIIDGQALPMFSAGYSRPHDQVNPVRWTNPPYNCSGECRPRLVVFERSTRVLVRDVTLQNSPDWTSHYAGCTNVLVDNITVKGDYRWPNNDGIDPDSTVNMTIRNSYIETGDDGLCPKASAGYGQGMVNLLIENCVVRSRSSAFKIGSTTQMDVDGILVQDVYVWDSNRGLGIQHRDNGSVSNIFFRNIVIDETVRQPEKWWGIGDALWVTSIPRSVANIGAVGTVGQIHFTNITVRRSHTTLLIGSRYTHPISNITMTNVSITVPSPWRPQRAGVAYAPPSHDYRPGIDNLVVCSGVVVGASSPRAGAAFATCDGIFFENVKGAVLQGGGLTFSGSRQPWWGSQCVGWTSISTDIVVDPSFACNR